MVDKYIPLLISSNRRYFQRFWIVVLTKLETVDLLGPVCFFFARSLSLPIVYTIINFICLLCCSSQKRRKERDVSLSGSIFHSATIYPYLLSVSPFFWSIIISIPLKWQVGYIYIYLYLCIYTTCTLLLLLWAGECFGEVAHETDDFCIKYWKPESCGRGMLHSGYSPLRKNRGGNRDAQIIIVVQR